jgi:Family of unknown function (DUF6340)
MKNSIYLIAVLFVFTSCASTEFVHISVLEPAPVTLPSYVKNISVVNRTTPSKKAKTFDVIDKALSLEGPDLDKAGAAATITGLVDELKKNNRFSSVSVLDSSDFDTDVPGELPSPLPWDSVEKYCNETHADALFSLELFDTKSTIDYSVNKTSIRTPLGSIPGIEQEANMHTFVRAGWRIYDVKAKDILDESYTNKTIAFHGSGMNPLLAARALTDRKEAVKEVGTIAGQVYAKSIIPFWIRVTREYYVRANINFKIATRMARTGNWDGAANIWEQETHNPDHKIAGRACYNMAIISEIHGDIDGAIEWARESYENYNIHPALSYVNILRNRKTNDALVAEQQNQ